MPRLAKKSSLDLMRINMKYIFVVLFLILVGCQKKPPQIIGVPPPVTPVPELPPPEPPKQQFEGTYTGTWVTTNRRLDGAMKCVLSKLPDKWQGEFSGVWENRPFYYKIEFSGNIKHDLMRREVISFKGMAVIDNADYQWVGAIDSEGNFIGNFTGNRYKGHFNLKRQ